MLVSGSVIIVHQLKKRVIGSLLLTVQKSSEHQLPALGQTKKARLPSTKLTAKATKNGWLEDNRFLLGPGLFSGAMSC